MLPGFVWYRFSEEEDELLASTYSFARELGAESPKGIGLWFVTLSARSFLSQTSRSFSPGGRKTSMKVHISISLQPSR